MNGSVNVKSRIAGILNIAAVLLFVILVVVYMTIGNFGIPRGGAETTDASDEEAAGQVLGIAVSIILIIPLILILLVPLGLVNVISGLVIGLHCLHGAPKRGAVIYSLILKIFTVPVFSYAILMIFALSDISGSKFPALFPLLFALCVALFIAAHVFEWLANVAAKNAVAIAANGEAAT